MTAVMNRSLRVVHFVESWLPPTMTWLHKHLAALPEDIASHVVCQWTDDPGRFPRKKLTSLDQPPRPVTLSQRALRRLGVWDDRARHVPLLEQVLQNEQPCVLHSHFGHYGWINSGTAIRHRVPHVVSFYGFDLSYLPHTDRRWVSRYHRMADVIQLVLCEGPHMADRIAALGVDRSKIRVLRLGVDLAQIPFRPRRNIPGGTKRILIAGSFREKKGIPYALEALGRLATTCPEIEITVIGDAGGAEREIREKQRIHETVERWNLSARTRLLGYQSHEALIQAFYDHDIFLSPSVTATDGDTEGGAPVTIIEAAASGMPVVSTRHCDIPFVLSHESAPYLVAERDSVALADAISRLLRSPDWTPLVAANRRLIEQDMDVRRQAHKLAAIYREMAAPSRRRVA